MSDERLSIDHLKAVLDNVPVAIFVSEIESKRLLYANQLAKNSVNLGKDIDGCYCYEFAGFDRPCSHCQAEKMRDDRLFTREFLHPDSRRFYEISGKNIDWGGKTAHIEYIVDITEKKKEQERSETLKKNLEATLGNIPCGLCVYQAAGGKILPMYHNPAFYNIMGYSKEHMLEVEQATEYLGVHPEDMETLQAKIKAAVVHNRTVGHTYRLWNDEKEEYRWIRLEGSVVPQEDGTKYLYGVYSDVTEQKELENGLAEAQMELNHLVNSIPGGIVSYRVEENRFIPEFCSDGVMAISGHTREELTELARENALNAVYDVDRERVFAAARDALNRKEVLDISFRMRHKNGNIIWVHLNGLYMGPYSDGIRLYTVFTGMSAEARLFQYIANESADAIYVIGKDNYDLLYANEAKKMFVGDAQYIGQKCYTLLHGKDKPCEFCSLKNRSSDGVEHEMNVGDKGSFYMARVLETNWNGVPAYIRLVRDVTETVKTQEENERLEEYFHTVVKNLPGGIAVVNYTDDGSLIPEYISDGFAAMTDMSLDEAWEMYSKDAMSGVHPDDLSSLKNWLVRYLDGGENHFETIYRLKKGKDGYIWVKVSLSLIPNLHGKRRLYAVYHDITKEREEQERVRRQYNDLILQHYRTPGPNALIVGHCNVTQNKIFEIIDYTNLDPLKRFGNNREVFFTGLSGLIVDSEQRQKFLSTFLRQASLEAFRRNETERIMECFIKLPDDAAGRYVQFKMNMVVAPDTDDLTGILTVTDITEDTIFNRIMHQLSVKGHDFVVDVDLPNDHYTMITCNEKARVLPPSQGSHTKWIAHMQAERVVPRDQENYLKCLEPKLMLERLQREDSYTFSYSVYDDNGDICAKNMTVSAVDLRLGRVCLSRADITDSVQEQQGLLNMIAYTFDLAGFIDVSSRRLVMYTRQTILENLPPYIIEDYDKSIDNFIEQYEIRPGDEKENKFLLKNLINGLEERPSGYEFLMPSHTDGKVRYKQINVLWGDQNHKTICMVRADVTDMLAAERKSQDELKKALEKARKADRAKSEFLSAMSHDIRTPMNAIMGMTELALAHLDSRERVEEYLSKISVSSKHLLSLINDVLDMSKIDGSKIELNIQYISLSELLDQLSVIMTPQAKAYGLKFGIRTEGITHRYFYGDFLRTNQVFINLLSNAVKFTPEGGRVDFLAEEIPAGQRNAVRYRFTVTDTGMGMKEEFLSHVFEPFVRSDNTAQIEGTGLGLSITKGLVDLMGGSISVKSEPGKGSCFVVELEYKQAQEHYVHPNETYTSAMDVQNDALLYGRNVLVAEDNNINAEITCGFLDLFGVGHVVKGNGMQAVEAFAQSEPGTYDAILMDIQMPQMNGYEATRKIRQMERPDAKQVPIIAMTANAFAEDVQSCLDAGMTAHISKPIDVNNLRITLCRLLGSRQ